jgi:transposase
MACDQKKLAYWSEHYRSWQASGLSQRDYCAQAGLSYSSFDHWRRRAREVAGDAPSSADTPATQRKLTLVPARLDASSESGGVELHSPGGWRIILPATLGQNAIAQLLSHLP